MTEQKANINAGWNFDNSYSLLPETLFTRMSPPPVSSPKIIVLNDRLAASLGLNAEELRSTEGAAMLAGNLIPEGAAPLAQAYAGHQFGHLNRLGDGRALLLGEQITPQGERVDIQYKGSGRTPYSRSGDGRAALGPMLREYIMSEAMEALGIPTTRSLAVVTTGESIFRETQLTGAILTRVAASHIRVGTFQFAANWGTKEELRLLADYTLQRHYPEALSHTNRYLVLLQEVIKRQAALIAKWQLVGFIHGVMNTDNMVLSGETIDYGPCAFLDEYDPATVFSSIDVNGRYAYGNQPQIGGWNLTRFAEALLPLLHEDGEEAVQLAEETLEEFVVLFKSHWLAGMRAKLGIFNEEAEDESLANDLLQLMKEHQADYTNSFRALTLNNLDGIALFGTDQYLVWQERWHARLDRQQQSLDDSKQLMRSSNPAIIPRNHRVEEALQAAVVNDDYAVMHKLLDALANPFAYTVEQEIYAVVPDKTPYQTYCGT
ncbi:protein adenylyltransferase SelO [Paenibacillus sinopodophylli]|uniref:protein adenylyltransferase SelO n=1 Tax=Paenibacillus sinopodophylli TaxID=1837342 RepID=UPI00110CDADC|nr:YdiU family protein [Paenibacillus sinopodophylli]